MHECIPVIVGGVLVVAIFLGICLWSLAIQRKAVMRQKQALDAQADAVERQKRAMAQVEESLTLSQKSVENQEQMIALLEEIRDSLKK